MPLSLPRRAILPRGDKPPFPYTRPFLKWAGGKFRLLDTILSTLPQGQRLVEPFVGSGAVFLNASYPSFLLCDCNADLIALYQHLQSDGKSYINYCNQYFIPQNNNSEVYYTLRERFNSSTDIAERGALFLYLNRHAYNGLVRYNAKGGYNVPYGKYKKTYFPQRELEHCYSLTLRADIRFCVQDFTATFAVLQAGDVVYADPPYVPLSNTASFTAYSSTPFGEQHHRALAQLAQQAAGVTRAGGHGIPVVISNHDTPFTRNLYSQAHIQDFAVQRTISCRGSGRSSVRELLALYER